MPTISLPWSVKRLKCARAPVSGGPSQRFALETRSLTANRQAVAPGGIVMFAGGSAGTSHPTSRDVRGRDRASFRWGSNERPEPMASMMWSKAKFVRQVFPHVA